jgi:hypothetical protein
VSPKTYKYFGTFIIKDGRYTFTFLTCDMYKSSLRHIHDPVLLLLKMKGIHLLFILSPHLRLGLLSVLFIKGFPSKTMHKFIYPIPRPRITSS